MNTAILLSEITFKAVRSSGPGGQHVNKVASKMVLNFDINTSVGLSEIEKSMAIQNLISRLTLDNVLILNCDENRSQLKNKEIVTKRFLKLIQKAILIPKKRLITKVPKSVIKKRIKDKKNVSETKFFRKKPTLD